MIRWPKQYDPARTGLLVHNEIDIPSAPWVVWSWLVDAVGWPAWYPNSANVRVDGGGRVLFEGATFRWKTFGVTLRSRVEECSAPERLGWSARGVGIDVYHAWVLSGTPSSCRVVTEESQNGWLARLGHRLQPRRMYDGHQQWLEGLRRQSANGPAPSAGPARSG